MELFLGVDGGQSHSIAVLVTRRGDILGVAKSGPCNHVEEPGGEKRFRETLIEITQTVLRNGGVPLSNEIVAACYGLTGYWERASNILAPLFNIRKLVAVEDTEIAQAAAFCGEAGIIVIAGTGAVGFGISVDQRKARSGGWGYLISDEGSGYDIGRRALQSVAQGFDGRGIHTALIDRILAHFCQTDFINLHQLINSGAVQRKDIASLAKIVAQAAREGDEVAKLILEEAAEQLARYAFAVARKLNWIDPPVVPLGGVFRAKEVILEPFRHSLTKLLPQAVIQNPCLPQVLGAILLAYRSAGVRMDNQLFERLVEEAHRNSLVEPALD